MKSIAIFSSVFLGLTLPTFTFVNALTPNSVSSLNREQFNTSGSFKIAQRYLTYRDVSSRLQASESRILNIAREYSGSQPVRWDFTEVEYIDNQFIQLNIRGKIMKRGKPHLRVGLILQRNRQNGFTIVNHDWSLKGRFSKIYRPRVGEALQSLPKHFPRFQGELNRILG